jgi:hypothetical protein
MAVAEPRPEDRIAAALSEQHVAVSADELEEMVRAYPALQSWIRLADELAEGDPAFILPLPESP